ncbi:MAG: hypothetical protein NUW21_08160, partial [Elusimicrobia bacterium]|nr:hypothetical protein [Elusimicrobiota bacterium]
HGVPGGPCSDCLSDVYNYQVPALKRECELLYEVFMNARSVLLFWHAGAIVGMASPHGREAMKQMVALDVAVTAYRDWACDNTPPLPFGPEPAKEAK